VWTSLYRLLKKNAHLPRPLILSRVKHGAGLLQRAFSGGPHSSHDDFKTGVPLLGHGFSQASVGDLKPTSS
jgi:hypothetical protein